MQEIVDTRVKINGKPLAELLRRGAKASIAKKHQVEKSYISQILKGERKNELILMDLVLAALENQKARVQLGLPQLQEKIKELQQLVAPISA